MFKQKIIKKNYIVNSIGFVLAVFMLVGIFLASLPMESEVANAAEKFTANETIEKIENPEGKPCLYVSEGILTVLFDEITWNKFTGESWGVALHWVPVEDRLKPIEEVWSLIPSATTTYGQSYFIDFDSLENENWEYMSSWHFLNPYVIQKSSDEMIFEFDLQRYLDINNDNKGVTKMPENTGIALFMSLHNPSLSKREIFGGVLWSYVPTEYVPLPEEPVKEGNVFAGWYYDENLTQPYISGEPIFGDTNLYAKFEPIKYHIIGGFVKSNGNVELGEEALVVNYGTKLGDIEELTDIPVGSVGGGISYDLASYDVEGNNVLDYTEFLNDSSDVPYVQEGAIRYVYVYIRETTSIYTVSFFVDGELYMTISVEHGAVLGDYSPVQNLSKNISKMTLSSNIDTSFGLEDEITKDLNLNIEFNESVSAWVDAGLWLSNNWIWLTAALGGALIVVVIFVVIFKRK